MAFLHTCLQSLCEEARLVMRGYYLEEKPRLSIFLLLLLSSVRDPHLSLSSLLPLSLSPLSLPVFTACFPTIAMENMMQVHPREGVEVFWSKRFVFFCLAKLSDTPTAHAGPAGLDPGIFQVLDWTGFCTTNPLSVFSFSFFFFVCV